MSARTKSPRVTQSDRLRTELKALHAIPGNTWRVVAGFQKFSGVPAGTLCGFAKGHPMPHAYRARFGLPDEKPAPVCLKCGDVHTTKRCTKNGTKPRQPRNYNGKVWVF